MPVDRLFSEARLADLYDLFCPWTDRGDFEFYLPYAMEAASVLDVGCGTGLWLRGLRERGHAGRLVGLDPAEAMLAVGRRDRGDIEWVAGDLASTSFSDEFDLVVMTGHAFQVHLTDAEVLSTLRAMRAALRSGAGGATRATHAGARPRLAFETRNPTARTWESWTPANGAEVTNPAGITYRQEHEVEAVDGGLVSFVSRHTSPAWVGEEVSRSTLRFLPVERLDELLSAAGLAVDERFGDFDGAPYCEASPEIITIARAA